MEKLYEFIKNLYNGDSRIMLYIYIAMAAVTIMLILIIIINSIITKRKNKKILQNIKDDLPIIETIEEVDSLLEEKKKEEAKKSLENEVEVVKEVEPILEIHHKAEIKPIPELKEEPIYNKPLEESLDLDLTRPIPRVSTATDLLNEFLLDSENLNITSEELNQPVSLVEDKNSEPVFSSVFLDKKEEEAKQSIITVELTPINNTLEPIAVIKPETKELILKPRILKDVLNTENEEEKIEEQIPIEEPSIEDQNVNSVIEEEIITVLEEESNLNEDFITQIKNEEEAEKELIEAEEIEERDTSLDTKIDIFSHESLLQKTLFDPFKPISQEDLGANVSKEEEVISPVIFSQEDLKNRLNNLRSTIKREEKVNEEEDILRNIPLDEIPEITDEPYLRI